MYLSISKSEQLTRQLVRLEKQKKLPKDVEIIIAPSLLALQSVAEILKKSKSKIKLAAQDVGIADSGPYTGGVSSRELKKLGITYAIVGHSERREHLGEDGPVLAKKAAVSVAGGLQVIYCVGETKDERQAARAQEIVKKQLRDVKSEIAIIAYEPRWAIGTGLAIEPIEAQQMHDYIAREMRGVPICYGGSVSDKNIYAFLSAENTEGVLVGSASTSISSLQAMFKRL